MKITTENIGEILQRMYDSEIDFHMGWLYDGGLTYSFKNTPYPLVAEYKDEEVIGSGITNMVEAFQFVVEDTVKEFPNSTFAKWYKERGENEVQLEKINAQLK